MTQFLAIVAYRCFVSGEPFDSVDIQVRWFEASDEAAVQKMLDDEQPDPAYFDEDGATVTWELAQIFSIDEFGTPESGEEIAGFIASAAELAALATKR
jgi:hypothetical protein